MTNFSAQLQSFRSFQLSLCFLFSSSTLISFDVNLFAQSRKHAQIAGSLMQCFFSLELELLQIKLHILYGILEISNNFQL